MGIDLATLAVKADSTDLLKLDKALDLVAKQAKKTETATEKAEKSFKQMGVAAAAGAAVSIAAVTKVAVESVKVFADIETRLVGVQKTTGFTADEMDRFSESISDVSTSVPVATASLLDIAGVAGQLGIKGVENVTQFTEVIGKLSLATDVVGDEGAASIARLLNVTGEGVENVATFGSVLVRLGNNSAATESQILSLATEIGQATSTFAVTSAETLAMGAALKSMGVSAELGGSVVGRAMRTIEAGIEAGGEDIAQLSRVTGIAAEDLNQAFGDNATDVFQKWVGGVGSMIEKGQSAATVLEGFGLRGEEVLKVIPTLAVNSGLLTDALALQADELGKVSALDQEVATAADTLAAQWQILLNVVDKYAFSLGSDLAPHLREVIKETLEWEKANGSLLRHDIGEWTATAVKGALWFAESISTVSGSFDFVVQQLAFGWEDISHNFQVNTLFLQHTFAVAFEAMTNLAGDFVQELSRGLAVVPGMEDLSNQLKIAGFRMSQTSSASEDYKKDLKKLNDEHKVTVKNLQDAQDKLLAEALGYDKTGLAAADAADKKVRAAAKVEAARIAAAEKEALAEERKTQKAQLATEERLRLKEHLATETNRLTTSELEHKLQALDDEVMAMSETADTDRELQDMITDYHSAKQDEIVKKYGESQEEQVAATSATAATMNEITATVVNTVIRGEDVKVAVASLASEKLSQFAVDAATKGLTKILSALGIEIGANAALGTAQSATDGDTWQQKLASGAAYLAGAGAAIFAGKALGDSFHADGGPLGWVVRNGGGGEVREGNGRADDVFAGFTAAPGGGLTRNMIMGGEYVIDRDTAQKNLPLLNQINGSKRKLFADGGPITESMPVTEDINNSGFELFVNSVIESKGNWKKAIVEAVLYYAGTGAAMVLGKELGPQLFAVGGEIGESTSLSRYAQWNPLDPLGINDKLPGGGGGGLPGVPGSLDWGNLWELLRGLGITGVKTADAILDPYVADMLTPSTFIPGFDTVEKSLEGALKGTAKDITDQLLPGLDVTFGGGGLLGSYENGTEYVPKTGKYLLHEGERVTPARENSSLSSELKLLREELRAGMVELTKYTMEAAAVLRKFDGDGLPESRGY